MRFILSFLILTLFSPSVMAQVLVQEGAKTPPMPKPLKRAVEGGSQIHYLGEFGGMNGWALIKQGKPEFYYATENNEAIVMGVLFDKYGEMVTGSQLAQLKALKGSETMHALTGSVDVAEKENKKPSPSQSPQTPQTDTAVTTAPDAPVKPLTTSEKMLIDLVSANWLTFGPNGRYEIFAFMDPDCPHCKNLIRQIQPWLNDGTLKMRVLPMGFTTISAQRAAALLASADPAARLLEYANGNDDAITVPAGINMTAVNKNRSVMRRWGFDATPTIVYKAGNGEIRIIRGLPKNYDTLLQDLKAK